MIRRKIVRELRDGLILEEQRLRQITEALLELSREADHEHRVDAVTLQRLADTDLLGRHLRLLRDELLQQPHGFLPRTVGCHRPDHRHGHPIRSLRCGVREHREVGQPSEQAPGFVDDPQVELLDTPCRRAGSRGVREAPARERTKHVQRRERVRQPGACLRVAEEPDDGLQRAFEERRMQHEAGVGDARQHELRERVIGADVQRRERAEGRAVGQPVAGEPGIAVFRVPGRAAPRADWFDVHSFGRRGGIHEHAFGMHTFTRDHFEQGALRLRVQAHACQHRRRADDDRPAPHDVREAREPDPLATQSTPAARAISRYATPGRTRCPFST